MPIIILGEPQVDLRTSTPVVYAQIPIAEYLELIGTDFDKFSIQRKRENHPGYQRMRNDIVSGALLPTITLAASPEVAPTLKQMCLSGRMDDFIRRICIPGTMNILDGLQRTYILSDLAASGHQFIDRQTVHVEIRIEENIKHLIYRIIVLNAGQKPMTMRHQVEILFSAFKTSLEREIPRLELFQENNPARRTRSRKYALERMATGYHAFLLRSPEVEKQNIVAQKISEDSVLSQDEGSLGDEFDNFKRYLNLFVRLDDELCRVYDGTNDEAPTGAVWLGSENVVNAFFAAVADFGSTPGRRERVEAAINGLIGELQGFVPGSDPIGLVKYQRIVSGFPVRKVNVGFATRRLLLSVFKEYFRDEGETPMGDLWDREAE